MQLREWIKTSRYSIKSFAETVQIERAMIYRYFYGAIPRAQLMHRIEVLTGGRVTAQDFYDNAVLRWNSKSASPASLDGAADEARLEPLAFNVRQQQVPLPARDAVSSSAGDPR